MNGGSTRTHNLMNLFTDCDRSWSGLQQLRSLIESKQRPSMYESLGFWLVEADAGRAVFEGVPGVNAFNPFGTVHGGYAAALLDSACGTAVHASLTADQAYTTLELKIQYHRAITLETGRVRAEGKLVTRGQRVAFANGQLASVNGDLLASATSTLLLFAR